MKKCSTCKRSLPKTEFYPNRKMKDGLQYNCRTCARKWHLERPDYIRRKNAEWKRNNPDYARDWQRKRNFGITREEVNTMLISQDYKCIGCEKHFSGNFREYVDHDHVSGKVRGLLCRQCNLILGFINDNEETLNRLALYLKKNKIGSAG